jgi:hypothetical protein
MPNRGDPPARHCMRPGCGKLLVRRFNEAPSLFATRWFCGRFCSAVVREQMQRTPPTYQDDDHFQTAVRALVRAHPLEFDCLYRSLGLAEPLINDRVQVPQQLSLIESNGIE